MTHAFYALPHSLYSGRARSYLIKNNIPFQEFSCGHESYKAEIVAEAKLATIPVLRTEEGQVIRDGAAIIEYFEAANGRPCLPATPKQQIISGLLDLIGAEGLLRPAMHYRWNFDEDNLDFILQQFGLFAMPHVPADERRDMALHAAGRMRKAAVAFGVTPEIMPDIEAAYHEILAEFNAHFSAQPYLLGGAPTIGDYGLFASLFAHLGRDPHPLRLMQQKAPMLFRWTERMRNPSPDMVEFIGRDENLMAEDEIPDTLKTLLRRVASDYLPEIEAMVDVQNQYLQDTQINEGDMIGGKETTRHIGFCDFAWRGKTVKAMVMPYRIFMLQRIQDAYDALQDSDRDSVEALLRETGLERILHARSTRRVERSDNREVWGAKT